MLDLYLKWENLLDIFRQFTVVYRNTGILYHPIHIILLLPMSVSVPDLPIGSIGWSLGPPAKVYNIFNTVIGLSHLHVCCHSVPCLLSNPSVIFLIQLNSSSEYCRILNAPHHLRLYWNWLNTLPSSSSREGVELGGAPQVE